MCSFFKFPKLFSHENRFFPGGTLTKMLENPQVKRLQSLSMDAIKNYVSMLVEAFCCYPFEKDLAKVLSYPSPVVSKKARKRGEKPPKEEEDMEVSVASSEFSSFLEKQTPKKSKIKD